MKINIQKLVKRISPVLCALLILLTLVMPAIPVSAEPASSHVTESSGDGYALYNGVKLPNIDSVWTDKETYPYFMLYQSPASGYKTFAISTQPLVYKNDGEVEGIYCGSSAATVIRGRLNYYDDPDNPHYIYKAREYAADAVIQSVSIPGYSPYWANYDVFSADGTIYLSASNPVPLDGMNVIEWDGDTTELVYSAQESYYRISDCVLSEDDVNGGYAVYYLNGKLYTATLISGLNTNLADDCLSCTDFFRCALSSGAAEGLFPQVGLYGLNTDDNNRSVLFAYTPADANGDGSGDSGSTEEPVEIRVPIYSSSGELMEAWTGEAPANFTVGENSLSAEFADYESYGREYTGDETFIGVGVDGKIYYPGDTFTLEADAEVYFITKKALNVYDHDTGSLLFSANGQLPMWVEIHGKSLLVYYADKTVDYQTFVISKGLQIAGISTILTNAEPQYTVNQSVRFEEPADIYVYWSETPVTDPAPTLPEEGPELIDPGSGDLWDDIFNDKLDINDCIDKLNRIETPLPNNFDFSIEHLLGGAFADVSLMMSAIADEGLLPQLITSVAVFILLAIVLYGSAR